MAKKKPHSQQRKKGQFGDTDDTAEAFDALSEEHTIADSLGTYESAFEDDDLDGAIDGTSNMCIYKYAITTISHYYLTIF